MKTKKVLDILQISPGRQYLPATETTGQEQRFLAAPGNSLGMWILRLHSRPCAVITNPPGDSNELWNVLEQWFFIPRGTKVLKTIKFLGLTPNQLHQISRSKWPRWFKCTDQTENHSRWMPQKEAPKLMQVANKKTPEPKSPKPLVPGTFSH